MTALSPWLIVILSFVAALGMWLLAQRGTHGWRLIALSTIPLFICLVYVSVGISLASSDQARVWVRYVLLYSLSVANYVIYSYYIEAAKFHKRRHNDR